MDKEKAFWRKVLGSDETKIELFGHNDQKYVWKREGEAFNPRTPYLLSSMVVVVLCSGPVLLPVELVLYRK